MLSAILGLATVCGWEAMGLHAWNALAFGIMAVSCAVMFVWQVREEQRKGPVRWYGIRPAHGFVEYHRFLLSVIRMSVKWTWRVKR